jgi:lipoprotein NlpI
VHADLQGERSAQEEALKSFDSLKPESPSPRHHQRAEVLFRLGRFAEAVADYGVAARGGAPHDEDSCWERGLALYYAGDYTNAAAQFARYHSVGATDVENGLWHFLCLAEAEGVEKARGALLDYTRMREAPFPALWALYRGEGSEDAVMAAAGSGDDDEEGRGRRLFYAHYYVGKYYEAMKDFPKARAHVAKALEQSLPYFMDDCAREDLRRLEARLTEATEKE